MRRINCCIDSAASSSVSQDYEKLLANAPFSDVIFDCEDKQIPAHKSILSSTAFLLFNF